MSFVKRTVLVTGGTGFLGSHLVKRLIQQGHEVILLRRISSNTSRLSEVSQSLVSYSIGETQLETIFDRHSIDLILHCATHYGRSESNPIPVIEANLVLPLSLLHLAITRGVKYFINTDTILDPRVNHYSTSKKQFLDWFKTYATQLVCVNVALEHFFGPGDDPSKFVSSVIGKFLQDEKTIPLTPGEQRRDFIYIDDAVEGFMNIVDWTFTQEIGFHHFEIGTGRTISIRNFVELIKKLSGNTQTELAFGALPYRPSEVMESQVDLGPLSKTGFRVKTSLEDGIAKTIEGERRRARS
jgi:CDP-paratose synthetase